MLDSEVEVVGAGAVADAGLLLPEGGVSDGEQPRMRIATDNPMKRRHVSPVRVFITAPRLLAVLRNFVSRPAILSNPVNSSAPISTTTLNRHSHLH